MAEDDSARIRGDGSLKAGLLWTLLGSERRTVASRLSNEELLGLNDGARAYRRANTSLRARIEHSVRSVLTNERLSPLPFAISMILLSITVALFLAHSAIRPDQNFLYLLSLFGPSLIGAGAPLSLYMIPAYRRVGLFRPGIAGFVYSVPAFVALLWLLYWINEEIPIARLSMLELSILSFGALTAPVLEEIVFRELVPGTAGRPPHFIGHFASAILFALLHLPADPSQFLYYMFAAALLSLLRILSGNLFWPIAVHGAANAGSLWIMQ